MQIVRAIIALAVFAALIFVLAWLSVKARRQK
jgi:uncharacterized membrane protein YcaP (DUF421 family)